MRKFRYTLLMLLLLPLVNYAQYTGGVGRGDGSLAISGKYLSNCFYVNGNWSTISCWQNAALPASNETAIVRAAATVDGAYSYADLNIEATGSVTISSGNSLTVSGTLTNSAGASGLVINSGGSLIQSTAGVLATVERDISAWTDNNHGWHFLSSPVATQAIAPNFTDATPENYDFYAWWEATNEWVNYKNSVTAPTWSTANILGATSGGGNFIPGKGYLVAYGTASTKQFTGTLNKDAIMVSNLAISTGTNGGWHLLGNPFSSALTWDTKVLGKINETAKIWKESTAAYIDIVNGGTIPSLNGFMVEVTSGWSGNNSILISPGYRVHDAAAWYKSSVYPTIKLTANDLSGQTAQESVIRFIPEATIGFDPSFDSHFLAGYAPQFYSVTGNVHLSTNALPEVGGIVQIPFHFIKNDGTSFTIEATSISNVQEPVILKDLKTNASQDLTQNPLYSFTSSSGDDPSRFIITFRPLGIGDPLKDNSFTVYASGNSIVVLDNTGTHLGNVIVYNMIGQIITQQKLSGSNTTKISLNSSNEYYIVKVVSNDYTFSTKVFLH